MADRQTSLPDFSAWIDTRQSRGLYFFTRKEALKSLKRTEAAFKHAAARLARKKRIARIHRGFFIIIPLEYAATGILPAEWFIADLMGYIGQPFYVGLLSAAALHGAAHQQPQQFHVVTTGPLREIRSNGLAITFFSRSRFVDVPLNQVKVQTGHIPVSTPEATALAGASGSDEAGKTGRNCEIGWENSLCTASGISFGKGRFFKFDR
jgi:predicted transcriptional regulator of viral defense system